MAGQQTQLKEDEAPQAKKPPENKFVFSLVEFHPRTHPDQTDDVQLSVNGEVLQIKRATEVMVHDKFLECARHGVHQIFTQEPGEDRKVVGEIMTYPFTVIKKGLTEEDFIAWKKDMKKKAKQKKEEDED